MINNQIEIQNLKCGGCVMSIERELSTLQEISHVKIDLDKYIVSFKHLMITN